MRLGHLGTDGMMCFGEYDPREACVCMPCGGVVINGRLLVTSPRLRAARPKRRGLTWAHPVPVAREWVSLEGMLAAWAWRDTEELAGVYGERFDR
jgi:hypothetical protein